MRQLLILDLDETLVSGQEERLERPPDVAVDRFFVYFRPHYKEFLEEMEKHFDIAIWTASSDGYALPIVKKLFEDLTPPVFVFTSERATTRYNSVDGNVKVVKRLKKVKVKFGYTLADILIVDDKKDTFQDNYGNGIEIKSFNGESNDEELLYLKEYILNIKGQNYREVYKENWRKETLLKNSF